MAPSPASSRTSPPFPARRPRGRSATPTTATWPPTARWSSAPTGPRGASWPARAEAPAGTASSTVSTRRPPTTSGRSATTRSPATWSSATTAPPGRSSPPSRASRCGAWTWSGPTRRGSPATPARPPPSSTTPRGSGARRSRSPARAGTCWCSRRSPWPRTATSGRSAGTGTTTPPAGRSPAWSCADTTAHGHVRTRRARPTATPSTTWSRWATATSSRSGSARR